MRSLGCHPHPRETKITKKLHLQVPLSAEFNLKDSWRRNDGTQAFRARLPPPQRVNEPQDRGERRPPRDQALWGVLTITAGGRLAKCTGGKAHRSLFHATRTREHVFGAGVAQSLSTSPAPRLQTVLPRLQLLSPSAANRRSSALLTPRGPGATALAVTFRRDPLRVGGAVSLCASLEVRTGRWGFSNACARVHPTSTTGRRSV